MWLGLVLAVAGIAICVLQFSAEKLMMPWYMPAMATIGLMLVALSVYYARTTWRILALVLMLLIAGGEWAALSAMRVPGYNGPVAAGKPFPAFATLRADGSPFTQADLIGAQNTVMVFFRGRW